MMTKRKKNGIGSGHIELIILGIVLGALFWVLESGAHVFVFEDTDFVEQIFNPEKHEAWMRFIVVGMFIAFGFYSHWVFTGRRRAEEEARHANTELTQIFETAADGMCVVDRDFNVLRANETFSSLLGKSKDETIGRKCYEVFPGPPCNTPDCPLTRILENGDRVEIDSEKRRTDGVKVPCIVTATPFRDPDGELIGIVEDFKDISERKRSEEELRQSRERLRDLASHLQVIREEERSRIAREIHDELGQALTALKMDLHWVARRLPGDEPALSEKTIAMSGLIDKTVQSVKRISSELRPGLLDDFGLSAAIEWQVAQFGKRTGIQCDIISDPEDIVLAEDHSIAIFRILQETLTNIARHAEASRVNVILRENPGSVEMEVHDNGKGIGETQVLDPKSFGIIGMRERAHVLGGDLNITGGSGQGTVVKVGIPIDNREKNDDQDSHRG